MITVEQEENDIRDLLKSYQLYHDNKVKNKIVKCYLSLIEKIARNYSQNYNEQYDDLVQVGCIGLISAIDKFDLTQKVSFKTYSYHFIIGEMKHYIRDHVTLVKLPRDLQEIYPRVNRVRNSLQVNSGIEPTEEDIAKNLDLPVDKIKQVLQMELNFSSLSLDQQIANDENSGSFMEQIEDKKYQSFQLAQEDKMILSDSLSLIKEQSQQVIEYAFYHDLSQTEIAKKLGISQMQVSRRMKGALKELWDIMNTRVTPW